MGTGTHGLLGVAAHQSERFQAVGHQATDGEMENLDQINVGFDAETRPILDQFGTNCLRMGRRLEEGFVVTDEPGIYFIPDLIDDWRKSGHCEEFLCFDKIEQYKDFGGIRIEDDILITKDGCRFIGEKLIPYHPKDVEAFMNK